MIICIKLVVQNICMGVKYIFSKVRELIHFWHSNDLIYSIGATMLKFQLINDKRFHKL